MHFSSRLRRALPPLRGAFAVKMNSDGRAYGGYCREIRIPMVGIRFHIIFVMLIPRGEGSCALEVMSVQTRRCFFLFRTILSREARPVISAMINTPFLIDRNKSVQLGGSLRAQPLNSLSFRFPFLSETKGKKTPPEGQILPVCGRKKERGTAKMSSSSRPYPSALDVMSTEFVIAHTPMPKAWAHLFRHFVTPSPRGEGSVAHRNFMSTQQR